MALFGRDEVNGIRKREVPLGKGIIAEVNEVYSCEVRCDLLVMDGTATLKVGERLHYIKKGETLTIKIDVRDVVDALRGESERG